MFDIYMIGTGGMQPLPIRKLASTMIKSDGKITLIDAGEGTQIGIKESGWCFKAISTILITHLHADHVLGLPGVLLAINNSDRTESVTIVGPAGISEFVNQFKSVLPNLSFPVYYLELTDKEEKFNIGLLEATAFKLAHTIDCYGYSLFFRRIGKLDFEKSKTVEKRYWSELQRGKSIQTPNGIITSDDLLGPERRGIKFTYVTDTRPCASIVKNAKNSDVFICEGMYTGSDPKDNENKLIKYHMTFGEAATLAKNANVCRLYLTHFSPSIAAPYKYIDEAKRIFENSFIGKDNTFITISYTKQENRHKIVHTYKNSESGEI